MPQANHIAFVQRGTVQRKGSLGGLLRIRPTANSRQSSPDECNQGVDLARIMRPTRLLPYRSRIVNSNGSR